MHWKEMWWGQREIIYFQDVTFVILKFTFIKLSHWCLKSDKRMKKLQSDCVFFLVYVKSLLIVITVLIYGKSMQPHWKDFSLSLGKKIGKKFQARWLLHSRLPVNRGWDGISNSLAGQHHICTTQVPVVVITHYCHLRGICQQQMNGRKEETKIVITRNNHSNTVAVRTATKLLLKSRYVCLCESVWVFLHWTASFSGKLSGFSRVLCATTQLMSLPLSSGLGTIRYSLLMVTVLSALILDTAVALPFAVVTHLTWEAGRPLAESQRATTTWLVPASTVTMDAAFWGLAGAWKGWWENWRWRERALERWLNNAKIDWV